MHNLFAILNFFARGGGGGSFGGGGGFSGGGSYSGGSYSGGSSNDPIANGIFTTIVLAVFYGSFLKSYTPRFVRFHPTILSLVVSFVLCALFLPLLFIGGGFFGISIVLISSVVLGQLYYFGQTHYKGSYARVSRPKVSSAQLAKLSQHDSAWNETSISDLAKQTFLRFQYDWSMLNGPAIANYMTPDFARKNQLMIKLLAALERKDIMSHVKIRSANIIDTFDSTDNEQDTFTVEMTASALDQLIDAPTNKIIYRDQSVFTEYWKFKRHGSTWLLADISQESANPASLQKSIMDFAQANNMYYSLDMGWLFLPRKGALFNEGSFGRSDINNHVIGSVGSQLIQIYTYTAAPGATTRFIAQITLPKSYEGIIVRPTGGGLKKESIPKGYQKYTFEWPDFNKRYEVYATNADRLAAFELVNPGFMAYLYDSDQRISLEVTDTMVYLYRDISGLELTDYTRMMSILARACNELQL